MASDSLQSNHFSCRIAEAAHDFPKIEARCQYCGFTLIEGVNEGLNRHKAAHAAECQGRLTREQGQHAVSVSSDLHLKLRCQ